MKNLTVAFVPGRFTPEHKGHNFTFTWLLSKYDRVIIGICSCYEMGSVRHPLLAFVREKMVAKSLKNSGVDMHRITFVHIQDFVDNWDGWWNHIISIPGFDTVTHFVTGNEKDILSEIKKRNLTLPFEFVNPEKEMPKKDIFPYHATDMREAIMKGDYDLFEEIAATGTLDLMGSIGGFEAIRSAVGNTAQKIVPGRQTVDMVVLGYIDNILHVLCGRRKMSKTDFPGYLAIPGGGIDDYENPLDAVGRETDEETNFIYKIVNRHVEPTLIVCGTYITELKFVGLFGSNDESLSGTQGGSSQVFMINMGDLKKNFQGELLSNSDLEEVDFRPVDQVLKVGLAYQQNEMLNSAMLRM